MSALAMRERARVASEALMIDTGVITRGAANTFNPATGLLEAGTGTVIYSGPMRLRQPSRSDPTEALFGEQQITQSQFIVDVPHDTTGVQVDDIVTLTDSDDADALVRRFRVLGIPTSTFALYKGLPVEVVE